MNRWVLGPPVQIAYAVVDARAAAHEWAERFGAGPFFLAEHIPVTDVVHRGVPGEFDHTSAYGQWGEIMVELVQDHGTGPSAVRDLYAPGETGLHHLAYFVDEQGFAAQTARMPGDGPTWIDSLITLSDESGHEKLFAKYVKVKAPLTVYQRGLVEFNDREKRFEKVAEFDMEAPVCPEGHPLKCRPAPDDGTASASARSMHVGGVVVGHGDAMVRFVGDDIDIVVWQAMSTRAGSERLPQERW